jgi:hypothetical protein
MLVGILAFGVYSFATRPESASVRRFEPGPNGKILQVQHGLEQPHTKSAPVKPLWKPEPDLVLTHAERLRLSRTQKERVRAVVSRWAGEKAEFEERMRPYLEQFGKGQGSRSLDALQTELAPYAELSREFDLRRHRAWRDATAVLETSQKTALANVAGQEAL